LIGALDIFAAFFGGQNCGLALWAWYCPRGVMSACKIGCKHHWKCGQEAQVFWEDTCRIIYKISIMG
jgi:hypothetical protein